MLKYISIFIVAIFSIYLIATSISFSQSEIELSNQFNQKLNERTTQFDNMKKKLSMNSQIAKINDSSLLRLVKAQMEGQKIGENTAFVWIQQSNPSISFSEVSKIYDKLGRLVEAERDQFKQREEMLQDIKYQHENLINKLPGSLINLFLKRKPLNYVPIQSDETEQIMKSGKDNSDKLPL